MSDSLDLDAYLRRIGHSGATEATADTLASLILAHVTAIPFENLDPLLGRPVRLDLASLQDKLLSKGRGGYCFEHNTLFAHVLREIGFEVTPLAARVVMNRSPDAALPRTHMLLLVEVDDEPMIVDVGFGGQTMTGPIKLESGLEQATPHEPFRMESHDKGFQMQALIVDTWTPLYEFDLQAQLEPDLVMMNHFTATFPDSVFLNSLAAARVTADGRLGLRNNVMSVHTTGAPSERRVLESGAAIRDALAGPFGIALPDDPGLDAVLDRFAGNGRFAGENV
jgi:N-hydroxyarylamine O-acetyltransferase